MTLNFPLVSMKTLAAACLTGSALMASQAMAQTTINLAITVPPIPTKTLYMCLQKT